MNPLTNVKNITKLNEVELASGSIHKKSWHDIYKDSAWIFIGGLSYDLTEGDILAVFSQYGEIVNINLVRDKKTGKTKGFCFLCYSNQKSTILAVDNFNGMKLCNRTLRVDHVSNYKPPKEDDRDDELTKKLKSEGCAPASKPEIKQKKSKKVKKEKKKKKRKNNSDESDSDKETSAVKEINIKKEKQDPGYDKYDSVPNKFHHRTKQDLDNLQGESSRSYERKHSRILETNNFQYKGVNTDERKFMKKIKLKRESSQHKESSNDNNQHTSSFKSHKRRSRSSSDDHSWNCTSGTRDCDKRDQSKNRHKDSKKYKNAKFSNSSSSDSESSSQSSSSGSEKNELKSSYPKKDLPKTYKEKRYHVEEYENSHHRNKESSYSSSKNWHYEKPEKYSEHWSKSKYKNDDSDDARKKSHHHKSRRDNL